MKIDFNNTEVAFKNKSNFGLKKAHLLFSSLGHNWIVNLLKIVVSIALKLMLPIKGIIKATVYKQFVGGESIEDCKEQVENLEQQNVGAILDYSAEGKTKDEDLDYTANLTVKTILNAKTNTDIPMAVFKPSGLGRFELFEKIANQTTLSVDEKAEWERVLARFKMVADAAKAESIPVLVDAEESWIQQPIDDIVTGLMETYNTKKALIYNTAQMYRWDRLDHLKSAIIRARKNNYFYGVKIVRGAYMEKERERAEEKNYKDPICVNKAATDKMFNDVLEYMFKNIDDMAIFAGTHNENSSYQLMHLCEERGIAKNDTRIFFGQLYGMSDNISYNLAEQGYNVAKYLPFGPVRDVMPYLIRRAEENTSVAGQTSRELDLIKKERKRRKL